MRAVPQFGERRSDRTYVDRPAAFGILEREGKIALVHIVKTDGASWHDLPGGGVDEGETAAQGVMREFGEEAGLKVAVRSSFALADQFFINTDGDAWNNRGEFFALNLQAEQPDLKIEEDHTLVWMEPRAAISALRHDSHAWAVAAWLRT